MRNLTKHFVLMLLCAIMGAVAHASAQTPLKGVVRVKLQPQVALQVGNAPRVQSNGVLTLGITPLDAASSRIGAKSIKRVFPYAPKYEAQMARFGLDCWYEVTFDESINPQEAANVLRHTVGVQTANCKVPMVLLEGEGEFRTVSSSAVSARSGEAPFNDSRLSQQWHYNNDGSLGGSKAGADINLFEAWKTTTGKKDVVVAIIDGGVDVAHEDLKDNMLANEAELNGQPNVDDDGNGYVDDVYGYNFCTNSPDVYPHSHGTHVAGTVGAVNNNGIGVCGVAGGDGTEGSGVSMISCQVFDSRSGSGEGDFAAAIVYAAHRGASIAQCSWGWASPDYKEQDVLDAIDYFVEMTRSDMLTGGIMFFATGNNGSTGNYYPGCYDKVVAVGAMGNDYRVTSYSNYGSWVDVVAPGGLMDFGDQGGVLSTLPGDTYGYNEGTSMATPHVSGIAALVLSQYGNANMLAETLRQQIITSVNDLYAYNSGAEGLHGSGYVDAAKALQMGDGTAPEAVETFSVLPAQDNVTLQWTIPASSDNNVNHHIIYYSTEAFDASSDLNSIKRVVADTKFMSSGDLYSYELKGLSPLTTYYIAIKAVNRWGNSSDLSPVVTATTNAGPKMTVDKKSLSLKVNATTPIASATFNISNTDEGLLKWDGFARTTQSTISSSGTKPLPGIVTEYNGKLSIKPHAVNEKYSTADFVTTDYPVNFKYFEGYYASIGDSDNTLPNSQAQWFYVDKNVYADGFNLTAVKIQTTYGTNPTIQIYRGNNLSTATKITEITPYFYSDGIMRLDEQHYFAPGESFWVVVHFPAQESPYTLGLATATEDAYSAYSFMSNDMGKTWVSLKSALAGSPYETLSNPTWAITAVSQNPDWSQLLVLDPVSGTVKPGETQAVAISNDGQPLCNGTYKFNVRFNTNESEANKLTLPVTISVTGQKPQMAVAKVVNFGDLLVGESKTLTVEVVNEGYAPFGYYGSLSGNRISCNSEHFEAPTYISGGFPARSAQTFDVTFAPKAAGSHTGAITFKHSDGTEFKVTVRGVATDPANIEVTPDTLEVGVLDVDVPTTTTAEFTIANTGDYPLEYVFPKFSDQQLEKQTKSAHKYGYAAESNLNGSAEFAYDGNAALIGGTDITSSFSDDVYLSKEIALGFSFPFYGKAYDRVYISSFGGIAFNNGENVYRSPLTETAYGLDGVAYISAYGYELAFGPESKVEYAKKDGKFVVNYSNVMALVYDQDYTPISFRIVLSSNGDIEVYYDSYEAASLFQSGSTLYCGIHDPEDADPLTVTSADVADYWGNNDDPAGDVYKYFTSQTAVRFVAPKASFITGITPAYGIINPGDKATLTASVAANENLVAGDTYNRITLLSNDPDQSTSYIRFNASVVGASLQPVAILESDAIDFGKVFRTSVAQLPVTVKNVGKDSLEVGTIALASGNVEFDVEVPFKLAPGMSKDIVVSLPTVAEGSVEDVMTITTNGGDLVANIKGEVIGVPTIELSYTEITDTLESGTELKKPLTISNNGNEPLVYAIAPNALIDFAEEVDENSKTSYAYAASVDGGTEYDWIDIETTGLGEQNNFSYYNSHDYVAVELPFEFPFYGKKYSKMYIYNTGFVSFTERVDQKMWPEPPATFPEGTIYTNIIAPYWGMHTMDMSKTAGTYHYITEDEAIVSFMEYGNTMNMGVCYQLIMKKDGSFKFQYKGFGEYAIIFAPFGLAGISNENASESIRLPERYLAFGNAVQFTPVVEQTVAAGASRTVDINVHTNKMAGNYTANIDITSNVPASEKIQIPVNLTITGTAKPVFPDTIVVQNVMSTADKAYKGPITQMGAAFYEAYFKVENQGTASFTINNIINEGEFEVYDSWFDETRQVPAQTWYYGWVEDWFGEEVLQWGQYYDGTPVTVDEKGLEISIPIMQGSIENTPGTYDVPLTFAYNESDTAKVLVRFIVTDAPYLITDKEEIRVENVSDDYVGEDSVVIYNYGQYKLTYDLRLDPSGIGEEISQEDAGGGIMPWNNEGKKSSPAPLSQEAKAELMKNIYSSITTMATSSNVIDAPQDFEYNDALFYPTAEGSNTVSYGTGNKYGTYKAATAYQAPEDGFNISHVYIATTLSNMDGTYIENADITVEIVNGDNYDSDDVLSSGTTHFESMEGARFVIVPLDKAVYMSPGQNFYVRVTYPEGVEYPAYMSSKEEAVVSNRYMGYVEGYGWFDVASMFKESYGSLGYIMTCLETTEGGSWVSLENDTLSGEIAPGESVAVKVRLNAASAPKEKDNKAVIVIKSNDLYNPVLNYPVYLSKNGSPVVTAPSETVYAKEADTAIVNVSVAEPEGDDMTIALVNANEMVSIKSATADNSEAQVTINEDETISVVGETGSLNIEIAIAPAYETAGSYSFDIVATDSANHVGKATVRYYVEHVNRAPECIEPIEKIVVCQNSTSEVLSLNSLFSDPDDDEMTFAISLSDDNIATMFLSGNDVIFMGKTVGETIATVTATDANGATTSIQITVEVATAVGIGNVGEDVMVVVGPNPVEETLYVTCNFNSDAVNYVIFDYSGRQMYFDTEAVSAGSTKAINVSTFAGGVYVLKVATQDGVYAYRILKK